MRKHRTRQILLAACVPVFMLAAARTTRADTVDIVHDGYGAYGATTFWAAGHNGNDIMSGVYLLNKTSGTGTGNTWSNGLIPGFCIEIQEPHPTATYTYDVRMPEDVYNNYTGQYLGTTKANYLRELWARYYDPAWTSGSYTAQQNTDAQAFAAAIWEIVYEKMPVSPAQWDVTIDNTMGLGGFRAENLDWETANQWLHSLTGASAKADLRVFVNDGHQEYLVAVPEPATVILLGLGGLGAVLSRRRRLTASRQE